MFLGQASFRVMVYHVCMTDRGAPTPASEVGLGETRQGQPGIRRIGTISAADGRAFIRPEGAAVFRPVSVRRIGVPEEADAQRATRTDRPRGGSAGVQEVPKPNRFHGENPITVFDGFSAGIPGVDGDTE